MSTRQCGTNLRSQRPVETNALIQTTLHLAIIGRKFDFSKERRLQQELVRREDRRTQRTPFLVLHEFLDELIPDLIDPPAQSVPPVPLPTSEEDMEDQAEDASTTASSKGTSRYAHPGLRRPKLVPILF